ncbi:MAG: hypothetical protein KCHDKBKB_00385 [Elusimicrobia bacterium]|nr:hypothetical protein [Elusimicrobiota bacterium]
MKKHIPLILLVIFLLGGVLWVAPGLKAKNAALKATRNVVLALDWEDVVVFDVDLQSSPASFIVLPSKGSLQAEKKIRDQGKFVLWRLGDDVVPDEWLPRFSDQDGLFIVGEHVLEHPRLIRELPALIKEKNGFVALVEFIPNKLLPFLVCLVPDRLIKGHLLSTREMMVPKPHLLEKRLIRSVEERGNHLLIIRFSPIWTRDENVGFIQQCFTQLRFKGFQLGPLQTFPVWSNKRVSLKAALVLSIIIPVLLLIWSVRSSFSIGITFLIVSSVTVLTGILIHGWGATPFSVLGIDSFRGVKLQLLIPLFAGGVYLINKKEWSQFLEASIKTKYVLWLVGGLGLLLIFYLMRSGNFPLVPVTDTERSFRDWLDAVLVVRPRFKEFLVGHPSFLLGLALIKKGNQRDGWARFFLWLGLLGQISILNTFTHFHSPLHLGLIRTFNGLWLGVSLALPGLILLHSRK